MYTYIHVHIHLYTYVHISTDPESILWSLESSPPEVQVDRAEPCRFARHYKMRSKLSLRKSPCLLLVSDTLWLCQQFAIEHGHWKFVSFPWIAWWISIVFFCKCWPEGIFVVIRMDTSSWDALSWKVGAVRACLLGFTWWIQIVLDV